MRIIATFKYFCILCHWSLLGCFFGRNVLIYSGSILNSKYSFRCWQDQPRNARLWEKQILSQWIECVCAVPCSQQGDIAARILIHTNIQSPKFILIGMHFLHQNILAQENLDAILSLLQNICTTKYLYNKEFFYGCQTYKRTLFSSWNRQYGMKTSIFQKFLCSVFYGLSSLPTVSCSVFSEFHDDSHSNSGWRKAASKLLRLPDPPSHSLFQHHLHRHQVHLHRHGLGHCQLNNCRCRHGEED